MTGWCGLSLFSPDSPLWPHFHWEPLARKCSRGSRWLPCSPANLRRKNHRSGVAPWAGTMGNQRQALWRRRSLVVAIGGRAGQGQLVTLHLAPSATPRALSLILPAAYHEACDSPIQFILKSPLPRSVLHSCLVVSQFFPLSDLIRPHRNLSSFDFMSMVEYGSFQRHGRERASEALAFRSTPSVTRRV